MTLKGYVARYCPGEANAVGMGITLFFSKRLGCKSVLGPGHPRTAKLLGCYYGENGSAIRHRKSLGDWGNGMKG